MQFNLFIEAGERSQPRTQTAGRAEKKRMRCEIKYQADAAEMRMEQKKWSDSVARRDSEEVKRKRIRERLQAAPPQTVVLVACANRKMEEAAAARDLYRSSWFTKARKFAEEAGDAWYILSALYGVITPDQVIEPYDQTLSTARRAERRAWAARAAHSLIHRIPPKSRIIILAGRAYRSELLPLIADRFKVEVPLAGLGIGQQLAFLKEINRRNERREKG